jgi:hypothetical protein
MEHAVGPTKDAVDLAEYKSLKPTYALLIAYKLRQYENLSENLMMQRED